MEKFSCCVCKGEKSAVTFSALDFDESVESFELLKCSSCGLAQTWSLPDPETLARHYSNIYYGSGSKKFSGLVEYLTVLGNKSRAKKIKKVVEKTRVSDGDVKVLDIGCGRANLLRSLGMMGCDCYGVEHKDFPLENGLPSIDIHLGSLEDRKFDDAFFDAVIIWHVLEHLYEPDVILDEVARITSKKGIVAIAVPNFSSLQSRWFKANWFHLDLPRHLFHFDVENLTRALNERGFVTQSVSTCSVEQNLFGFIQSVMNSFRFLGKPNSFYQLLKNHSGFKRTLKLAAWALLAMLILPFALLELLVSCALKKGASVIIFAYKK